MTHFGSKTFVEYRLVDLKVIQWKRKKREKADGFGNRRYAEEPKIPDASLDLLRQDLLIRKKSLRFLFSTLGES